MEVIHETAIVASKASIGKNVSIGAFSVIGPNVVLEEDVLVHEHVIIKGNTYIGKGTVIYPFACIGLDPQMLEPPSKEAQLKIGEDCIIREHVTVHPGTEKGGLKTIIGNSCLLMVSVHVAHDCTVGNRVTIANNTLLAGHVTIDDECVLGGHAAVLQFVRVGKGAMICGKTGITNDVMPYAMVFGTRGTICGINIIGLKRRGYSRKDIREIKTIYNTLFDDSANDACFEKRVEFAQELAHSEVGNTILNFCYSNSKKGYCHPKKAL